MRKISTIDPFLKRCANAVGVPPIMMKHRIIWLARELLKTEYDNEIKDKLRRKIKELETYHLGKLPR